jgi:hypothetical protein
MTSTDALSAPAVSVEEPADLDLPLHAANLAFGWVLLVQFLQGDDQAGGFVGHFEPESTG